MLTVLWVLSMAGMLATTSLLAGRSGVGAARNRIEWSRARWRAAGCARRAQSVIDGRLYAARRDERSALWRSIDVAVDSSWLVLNCEIHLAPAGGRLDINSATTEMLERLFAAQGIVGAHDAAAAVASMRDSAPIADLQTLRPIRPELATDSLLAVDAGRVALSSASATVLQAIPGFSREVAEAVVRRRTSFAPLNDLHEVLGLVSRESARDIEDQFQEIARVATVDPDAWILRSIARGGSPEIAAVVEWRFVRQDDRVVVSRASVR